MTALAALVGALALQQAPEVVSPAGRPFFARPDTAGVVSRAEQAVARHPSDSDTLLALGLALASTWRYRDAVAAYTTALTLAPWRAILYRHRGHRFISLRRFGEATADLERAVTLDSTSFDIWYHLGLVYYLTGRFDDAAGAYQRSRAVARSADDTVAASDWLWMSLRRAGREADAVAVASAISDSLTVRENTAYYARLRFYAGRRSEAELRGMMEEGDLAFATVGYGLANWHFVAGDTGRARALLARITDGPYWPAFGFIAAEADLARLGPPR